MRKKKVIIIALFLLILLTGCGKSEGSSSDSQKSTYEEVNYKPTFSEIVSAVGQTTLVYGNLQKAVLESKMDAFSEVELNDFAELVKGMKSTYNSGTYFNTSGQITIENIAQFGLLANTSATIDSIGPILIIKGATLNSEEGSKEINLVILGGTEPKDGQATFVKEDFLSGMNLSNEYLYDVYYAIYDHIINSNDYDKDTPLVIAGYSLGSMVAQQAAALKQVSTSFSEIHVVAMATMLLAVDDQNYDVTTVRRIVDVNDIVPVLGLQHYQNAQDFQTKYGAKNYAVVKQSTAKTFIGAHVLQYMNSDLWGDVDALGYYKNLDSIVSDQTGMEANAKAQDNKVYNYSFTFDRSQMNWYPAPTMKAASSSQE